nr:hypothetical protein [Tanacetum cinerariifolium]
MRDENPIRTLGDYFKSSHEGYRNTNELPVGNNMVPFRSDTIRLTHLTLTVKTRKERAYVYFNFPFTIKLAIGSNVFQQDPSPHGIIEYKVDGLMNNALSAMGKSQGMFEMTRNEMYRQLPELSRQAEFKHIVTNFIFDQEERIRQLEDYMQVITEEFMEFSSEVARRLKERIMENENKPRKIEKITKYPDTKVLENSAKHNFLENLEKKTILHCASGLSFLMAGKDHEEYLLQSIDEVPFKMGRCKEEIASRTDAPYLGPERDRVVADLS